MPARTYTNASGHEIVYRRVPHAGHYGGGRGHDLEQWDVCADLERGPRGPRRSDGIPTDAEYHSGYIDKSGLQHWLFTRIATLTPGLLSLCPCVDGCLSELCHDSILFLALSDGSF